MANGLSVYDATQITDKIKECGLRLNEEETQMVINLIDGLVSGKLVGMEYLQVYDIVMKLR